MPTILTHAAVPLAIAIGLGRSRIPRRLMWTGVAAAAIPDADVICFAFGLQYGDAWGHRGATHSLAFALLLALVAVAFADRLRSGRWATFVFVALAAASHGLLDMLTDGGLGIALFWPLTEERYFFPARVIEVSPIGLRPFLTARGIDVLASELLWVWLPCTAAALFMRVARAAAEGAWERDAAR